MAETLFDLPIAPDEFGVLLPPAELRRIRYSALDYDMARRALIEYIRTYFPNDFNDFVASNGIIMLVELFSAVTGKLSLRGDMLMNEAFLSTATTEEAVSNHLQLINQRIRRQTPATVDVEVALDNPLSTDVQIPAGTTITTNGPDGSDVVYEVYAVPDDFTSAIVIQAGKRGVVAFGIEGSFATPSTFTSSGGPSQSFEIIDAAMLESPILVTVKTGDIVEDWRITTEPIERFGPNDKVVEVIFLGEKARFVFGDDVNGKALLSGQQITIRYRAGGGIRGRVGVGQLSETRQATPQPPANAPVTITLRNVTPSEGGTDRETIEDAKRRAPREFAAGRSIVTAEDYAQISSTYSHPVFGTVVKAVATLRSSLNANQVEIYCLAIGSDGKLVAPSSGLKRGLSTFLDDINVLTDYVAVLDGAVRPVNLDMTVVISRNADATVVKDRTQKAIDDFFNADNWQMGEAFYISNFIEIVEGIDGVSYVDLFLPADNILATGTIAETGSDGIGFNELIVLGSQEIRYYYEHGRV